MARPRFQFGWLTALTIVLLTLFGAVDLDAHMTNYEHGETFSAFIWWLEKKTPAVRVLVGAAVAVLFTHLVFGRP